MGRDYGVEREKPAPWEQSQKAKGKRGESGIGFRERPEGPGDLRFERKAGGEVRPGLEIPEAWGPAREVAREGGVLLVVGASDLGKSTLAAVVAREAVEAGRGVAVVDADVGQSSIGPPGCVSWAWVERPITALSELTPEGLDFVGTPSPVGHLLGFVTSTVRMVEAARAAGAGTVVVDTTGLVAGPVARALKGHKIRLLDPEAIVALQAEEEVEHLLSPYRARPRPRIIRVKPSRLARVRSREQRTEHRRRAFAAYFRDGHAVGLDWKRIPMENTAWTTGEVLPGHLRAHVETVLGSEVLYAERGSEGIFVVTAGGVERRGTLELRDSYGAATRVVEEGRLRNLLVGLLGEKGETRALGILERVDFRARRMEVFTPGDGEGVRGVRLGAIQVARDGTQEGWVEAGELG
jgi:polynucleotide 5'-hydroxyl-kinase GRC3/NOL9